MAKRKCRNPKQIFGCENEGGDYLDLIDERDDLVYQLKYAEQRLQNYKQKEQDRKARAKERKAQRAAFREHAVTKLIGGEGAMPFEDVVAAFVRRIDLVIGGEHGDPGPLYPMAERVERVFAKMKHAP